MKYSKTLIAIASVMGLIAVFALMQKCEVIDGNIHVTSRSLISAWDKEIQTWTPLVQAANADKTDYSRLKAIYNAVNNPKTTYKEFETWVSMMSDKDRKYTRQEVVTEMIRKK